MESGGDTGKKMGTKPSFIIIKLDRSLLPRLSVLAHHKTCDHCIAFYQNGFVMSILPDAENIEDVMSAIKAKYRIDVAIKLTSEGIFFPPQLPVEILAKFERNVFRVSPLRKQKFDMDHGCTVRQSQLCQVSVTVDAGAEASQRNAITTGASSDWETFTDNLNDEEDSGMSDSNTDDSDDCDDPVGSDNGQESSEDDENVSQEELPEDDDSPDYNPKVPQEETDADDDTSDADSIDSGTEQSSLHDTRHDEDNQDREGGDKEDGSMTDDVNIAETQVDDVSAAAERRALEITDLKGSRNDELQELKVSTEISLQTSDSVISAMNKGAIEESTTPSSPVPNTSSSGPEPFCTANGPSSDHSKWSLTTSEEISAVPEKKESTLEEKFISSFDTNVDMDLELKMKAIRPVMTSTPNKLIYGAPNISISPEIFQVPIKKATKLKRALPSYLDEESLSDNSKRSKHSIIAFGKTVMRSFVENLCDRLSSNSNAATVSTLERRASGPPTPHPSAIIWPYRCPTSDNESQNPENWIPVASKTAADIPPGSCIKFKVQKDDMEGIVLQVESITNDEIIGYSLQEGNKDAVSIGPKCRTKRMLSFAKNSMEDVFILSRARAFGIDISNTSFSFD